MEKELYFAEGTIDRQAGRFLREFDGLSRAGRIPFRRESAALLLLDLQEYFLDPASHAYVPSAPALVPRLVELAEAFVRAGQPVWTTLHLDAPASPDAGAMGRWWPRLLTEADPRVRLVEPLARLGLPNIVKGQYDAFYGTSLLSELKARGVEQVVIGGVMAHLCCETTARSAFVQGFDVFFLVDGTATFTRAFHRSTLRNLAHGFAVLTHTRSLLDQLGVM